VDRTELEHDAYYTLDEYTNQFLTQYPVYCELRTSPLGQRLLHSHNGFEFYLCLNGLGSYIVGDQLYPLKSGTLTVIRPNVIHRPFSGENKPFHRYVLSISESYLDRINAACHSSDLRIGQLLTGANTDSSHYILSVQQLNRLELLLSEVEKEIHAKTSYHELAVLKSISEFFILIISMQTEPYALEVVKSEDNRIIGEVLSYLIAHYQEKLHIDDLLQLYPISRSQLFHIFKETTGNTIKQFLTEYRLNKAKRLLVETALPVTEVAWNTGFGDISHFFKVFKKGTGLTPKQFRSETVKRKKGNPIIYGLPYHT
jgi:AraC-like DNA-binding protein